MKLIYIFCNGSRGDCEPGICLAQHIIKNGNSVRIYCNDGNESLLKKSGLDYVISFKNYINKPPEEVSMLDYYKEAMDNMEFHIDTINSIERLPDIVIGMGDMLGKFLSEKHKIPYYHIVLQYFDVPSFAKNMSYLDIFEEGFEKILRKIMGYSKINYFNTIRNKYNLPPINDFLDYIHENKNTIVANSLILSNFNYIKHDKIFISGNYNLIKTLDNSIDEVEGLKFFLEESTDYIYINLGSWSQYLSDKLLNIYIESFKSIPCKVIIGCNKKEKSNNKQFFYCNSINHHELFSKMSIIIHCGGLGIAFKAAYHGIPQIIIPKKFEEPFWAQKIRELGCGDFIEFKNLTSKNLNSVVNNVMNNIMIKHNATMLSQSINIDGVKNTYEYLKI